MGGADSRLTAACGPLLERCTFPPPGDPIVVAVSGGPDSSALLALAAASGCTVSAVHVDHRQRSGSHRDAEVVAELARRFGSAFEACTVEVEPGPNLEARLRAARWKVLPDGAATGHTADDRAETVLLNMMRGAGLTGLASMEGAYHPIIALRRSETRALCASLAITPLHDPSNEDASYRRNRVRHELLPLMDAIAERDVAALIARQAALVSDDVAFLDDMAGAIDPTESAALAAAPVVLARRAIRIWLSGVMKDGYAPSAAAVERVLDVARGGAVGCDVGQGVSVRRSAGRLRIVRETGAES